LGKTEADLLFKRYLLDNGYRPGEHEPDLSASGVETHPDYLVARGGQTVACEVKSFRAGASKAEKRLTETRSGVLSAKETLGPIRNQLKTGAKQLKPLADWNIPLVIVLANPEQAFVHLSVEEVAEAMYGDPTVVIPLDPETGEQVGPDQFVLGRDGKLTRSHQYVSAVAALGTRPKRVDDQDEVIKQWREDVEGREFASLSEKSVSLMNRLEGADFPEGDDPCLDVIETLSESATPLPDSWFSGPFDTRWRSDGAGSIVRVR